MRGGRGRWRGPCSGCCGVHAETGWQGSRGILGGRSHGPARHGPTCCCAVRRTLQEPPPANLHVPPVSRQGHAVMVAEASGGGGHLEHGPVVPAPTRTIRLPVAPSLGHGFGQRRLEHSPACCARAREYAADTDREGQAAARIPAGPRVPCRARCCRGPRRRARPPAAVGAAGGASGAGGRNPARVLSGRPSLRPSDAHHRVGTVVHNAPPFAPRTATLIVRARSGRIRDALQQGGGRGPHPVVSHLCTLSSKATHTDIRKTARGGQCHHHHCTQSGLRTWQGAVPVHSASHARRESTQRIE